jgi:hypothetical protein
MIEFDMQKKRFGESNVECLLASSMNFCVFICTSIYVAVTYIPLKSSLLKKGDSIPQKQSNHSFLARSVACR